MLYKQTHMNAKSKNLFLLLNHGILKCGSPDVFVSFSFTTLIDGRQVVRLMNYGRNVFFQRVGTVMESIF